jgi:uncharacterized lipoprotein YmbA
VLILQDNRGQLVSVLILQGQSWSARLRADLTDRSVARLRANLADRSVARLRADLAIDRARD